MPSPFREMLDNFSITILQRTDKVVDERLMSSLTKQLAPVAQQCESVVARGALLLLLPLAMWQLMAFLVFLDLNGGIRNLLSYLGRMPLWLKQDL